MGRKGEISYSKEDEEYIALHYRTGNTNEIAKHLGLTRKKVTYIASRLGEKKDIDSYDNQPVIFNDDVLETLRKLYPFSINTHKLAEQLGLSYTSMVCICNKHGIHKDRRTRSAVAINNMYDWGYETLEEIEQAYDKICSVIRAEYSTIPDAHDLEERLGMNLKNIRSIAMKLGIKRSVEARRDAAMMARWGTTEKKDHVMPEKPIITNNMNEIILREYADETDNNALAERLGITRRRLTHLANEMGVQKTEEAMKVIKLQAIMKGYGTTLDQFSYTVGKVVANYPTCDDPRELAKELGISYNRMRHIANTRGIRREKRSTAGYKPKKPKEPKAPKVTKPKAPQEPKAPKVIEQKEPQKPQKPKEPAPTPVAKPTKPISKEARNEQLRRTPEAQDIIRKSGFPQLGIEVLKVRLRGRQSVQGDFTPDHDLLRVLRSEQTQIANGDCIGRKCYCAAYCGGLAGKFTKHCITK